MPKLQTCCVLIPHSLQGGTWTQLVPCSSSTPGRCKKLENCGQHIFLRIETTIPDTAMWDPIIRLPEIIMIDFNCETEQQGLSYHFEELIKQHQHKFHLRFRKSCSELRKMSSAALPKHYRNLVIKQIWSVVWYLQREQHNCSLICWNRHAVKPDRSCEKNVFRETVVRYQLRYLRIS